MKSDNWNSKYKLACNYYNYYGNLNIRTDFKTINGIDYDDNGVNLGIWIHRQRKGYMGCDNFTITPDRIKLLNDIGMIWNTRDNNFEINYNLAKKYYEHYGNLDISKKFKTNDGINYSEDGVKLGDWITTRRVAYKGELPTKITKEEIDLLNCIGMIWNKNKYNYMVNKITERNKNAKKLRLLKELDKMLNSLNISSISSRDDIDNLNREFIKRLK